MTGIADAKLSDPEGIVHGDRGAAGENARWYAVHTQPKREFYARLQLEGQGFRVFLPKGLKTIRHARKMADVEAAFFPRYLFVELDLTRQPWRRVQRHLWGDEPCDAGRSASSGAARGHRNDGGFDRSQGSIAIRPGSRRRCAGSLDRRSLRRTTRHPRSPRWFRSRARPARNPRRSDSRRDSTRICSGDRVKSGWRWRVPAK